MRIAFVWNTGSPREWDDRDLERGVGGSQAMMILYARQLAKMGHEVVCYTPYPTFGNARVFHGVRWESALTGKWRHPGFDVVVSLRNPYNLMECAAPVRVFLANDQDCPMLPLAVASKDCNLIITISEHQTKRYQMLYPDISPEIYLTSSAGVEVEAYEQEALKTPTLCIYCSTPERGLAHLERLWPRIVEKVPLARLVVTGGFDLYGWPKQEVEKHQGELMRRIASLPNVIMQLNSPRHILQAWQKQASVMLYPSTYDEMCCISALECAAARCAILTTDRAALSERVIEGETGYLIPGEPGEYHYDRQFVLLAEKLLTDRQLCARMGVRGHVLAAEYAYWRLSQTWVERFIQVKEKDASSPRAKHAAQSPIAGYIRHQQGAG